MKFKSSIYTQVSGSIGGTTFAHNRGGMYTRARATPTNPNTPAQQAIRALIAQFTSAWLNVLTRPKRRKWDTYAENVPLLDKLGEPRNVGGLAMYVRSNVSRVQAALARIDDAPTIFNLGDYTAPTMDNVTEAGASADINFTVGDEWASEDGAAMLVWLSRPQNASINFFKGPYQFAGLIAGDSVTPPTSPATILTPFEFGAGQQIFGRANVVRADARMGADVRFADIAVA